MVFTIDPYDSWLQGLSPQAYAWEVPHRNVLAESTVLNGAL